MMPPALLLVRIGTGRFLVPLPLFLGWPLLLIGYLLIGLAWLLSMGRAFRLKVFAVALIALEVIRGLRGVHVEADTGDRRIALRFV